MIGDVKSDYVRKPLGQLRETGIVRTFVNFKTLSAFLLSLQLFEHVADAFTADGNQGLTTVAVQPVVAVPKLLRVVLPMKAEEATSAKAIERLSNHIATVSASLKELGAGANSIQFAGIDSNPSTAISSIANMTGNDQAVWQVQEAVPNAVFAVQAQVAQGFALPPSVTIQGVPNSGTSGEATKSLPKLVVATSTVAADWNIEGKSDADIAILKSKLIEEIAKRKLDGSELFHKFTEEQEDEIFELTKIDIRNGDSRSMFATPVAAPKVLFIGNIPEQDYNSALTQAFESAEKRSKQLASAVKRKLGKMEYVNLQVESRLSSREGLPTPVIYGSYPGTPTNSQTEWEPAIQADEFQCEHLNHFNKKLVLTVRFQLE